MRVYVLVCVSGCRCGARARGRMCVRASACRCLPRCPAVSVVSVPKPNLEHQCESLACVASVSASACCACLGVGRLFASRVYPALGVSSLSCLLWVPAGLLWNHSSAQHAVIPVVARAARARCARVPWDVHRRVFRGFVSADGGNTQRLRLCVSSDLLRGATDQTRECSPSAPRTA